MIRYTLFGEAHIETVEHYDSILMYALWQVTVINSCGALWLHIHTCIWHYDWCWFHKVACNEHDTTNGACNDNQIISMLLEFGPVICILQSIEIKNADLEFWNQCDDPNAWNPKLI